MLYLTKLDGSVVLVNLDGIKYIEATPDTRIQFINGDMMIIKESLTEIAENVIKLKSRILKNANLQQQ